MQGSLRSRPTAATADALDSSLSDDLAPAGATVQAATNIDAVGIGAIGDGGVENEAEAEAALALVLEHVAALRRYALLLVGDASEADDLVQECLLRVVAQARAWRPVRDMRAYMFATLHNVFVDGHRRRRSRQSEIPIDTVVADLAAPASQTKWLEVRDLVAALGKIPPEQREVVLLVGVEGMSYMEAAEVVGVPIGTIMSRLSRGRDALRQLTSHAAPAKLRVVK